MEIQFANLVQGSMTVDEYTTEFTRLSRFYPPVALTKKFRRGLRQEIQDDFAILRLTTFDEVLETARTVELVHQRRRAAAQQALVRRPAPAQPLQHIRQRLVPPQRFSPVQGSVIQARPGVQQAGQGVVCRFCRQPGHIQKDCRKKNRLCLACGSADHLVAACPRRRFIE